MNQSVATPVVDQEKIAHILIVEDDMALQTAYKIILQSQGYHVSVAGDGVEALQALRADTPDVILLDFFMPRMDGKTFLQNFDSNLYPTVQIVLASNISDQVVIDEIMSLGAHRSVLKADMSPAELLGLVEDMVQHPLA